MGPEVSDWGWIVMAGVATFVIVAIFWLRFLVSFLHAFGFGPK